MSPLIKKALFRIRKLRRPPIFGGPEGKDIIRLFMRSCVGILMTLALIGITYSGKLPVKMKLSEGDITTEDIYAPFSFSYEAGIDEAKTKKAQDAEAARIADIYTTDPQPLSKAEDSAERFFAKIISLKGSGEEVSDAQLEALRAEFSFDLTMEEVKALLGHPDIASLKEKTADIIKKLFSYSIISDEARQNLINSKKESVTVYNKATGKRAVKGLDELHSVLSAKKEAESLLGKAEIAAKEIRSALNRLINLWLQPNLAFSLQETEAAKKEAVSTVPPIYRILERVKGESIIRKGQRVTKEHIIQLARISTSYETENIFSQLWGIVILLTLLVFLLIIYLKYFEPKIFSEDKLILLVGLSILFAAISAKIVISSPLPSYFIPVATVAMLLTLLINGSVAAITAMAVAIIVAIITGAKFNIFLVSMVGGISAVCTVYHARHRSQIIKAGIYVGILNFVTIGAIGILSNFEIRVFLKEGLWGIANGITSAAIAMVLLPVLESVFKLTTDIKLLELSDLNHPLLKEMVMKAAGTYHHSLVVGNLAEAATSSIGANGLLARVASYYHDIGKTQKAEYFAENQQAPVDTHSRLSPSMSSLIITNHVKDAVELAEKYKLGAAIKDIIEQHHGAGLVTYFYHQAVEKEKAQQERILSEEGFRYPGPKPQTKESAIVMLADSVEAASRVIQGPTPQRLKELVRKIINNKFIDRQLDECDLTLKDINKIADSFVKILTGIYHSRVEYPSAAKAKNANTNKQRAKRDKAQ